MSPHELLLSLLAGGETRMPGDADPAVPLLTIDEADYMFCTGLIERIGALRLRVDQPVPPLHPNLEWVRLIGYHLPPDGGPRLAVDVLVRVTALVRALGQAAVNPGLE